MLKLEFFNDGQQLKLAFYSHKYPGHLKFDIFSRKDKELKLDQNILTLKLVQNSNSALCSKMMLSPQ